MLAPKIRVGGVWLVLFIPIVPLFELVVLAAENSGSVQVLVLGLNKNKFRPVIARAVFLINFDFFVH